MGSKLARVRRFGSEESWFQDLVPKVVKVGRFGIELGPGFDDLGTNVLMVQGFGPQRGQASKIWSRTLPRSELDLR